MAHPPDTDAPTAGKSVSILLVDDQPANLLALRAVLGELGHNLVEARSGEEALRRLADDDYAVVLLDVQMRGLDGFETARQVRSREESRHTPIIFLTAHEADRPTVERAYALGAVDFLVKPLVPVILKAKVVGFVELFQKAEHIKRQAEELRRVERRELNQRLADELEAMTRLHAVSARLLCADNLGTALDDVLENAIATSGADFGNIQLYNPQIGALEIVAQRGFRQDFLDYFRTVRLDEGSCCAQAMRSGERMIIEDVELDPTYERHRPVAAAAGYRAVQSTPLKSRGGSILGMLSTHFRVPQRVSDRNQRLLDLYARHAADMIERFRFEAALRRSEAQFRQLADAMPQIVWAAQPDGSLDYYNERWYEYTGFPRGESGRQSWEAVLHADDVQRCVNTYFGCIKAERPYQIEHRFKDRRTGGYRWFLGRAVPVRDEQGKVVRWFGTCTDIDDTKRAEEALREANRHKDEFLAMLAHELRNPLAPIRNALHVLKLSEAGHQAVEKARTMMERQVGHLARIVDDLLDVSRITRGKIVLRRERLDLGRLVRVVTEDDRPAFERAGITLDVAIPELPVWVMGDATRLTQVLGNLLQNALKFSDGGGQVSVRVSTDADQRQAVVVVQDNGVGIEPRVLPHLFETFTQADRSLDRSKGGLGLGLALVKGLVELHGGEVRAASPGPGRGAEFSVRLPAEPEPAALTEMPAAPKREGRHLRILVVEDNQDAADSLRMLLELYGYEVTVAYSGPEGVAAAEEWRPDVVLCDIGLPGLDGYGVVGRLRRNPSTAKARIIAVTGYGGDEDKRRTAEAGFDKHMVKPIDPGALEQLLTAVACEQ
jgi:PAS domain S-box-containing protein